MKKILLSNGLEKTDYKDIGALLPRSSGSEVCGVFCGIILNYGDCYFKGILIDRKCIDRFAEVSGDFSRFIWMKITRSKQDLADVQYSLI